MHITCPFYARPKTRKFSVHQKTRPQWLYKDNPDNHLLPGWWPLHKIKSIPAYFIVSILLWQFSLNVKSCVNNNVHINPFLWTIRQVCIFLHRKLWSPKNVSRKQWAKWRQMQKYLPKAMNYFHVDTKLTLFKVQIIIRRLLTL